MIMGKNVLMLILAILLCASGYTGKDAQAPTNPPPTEAASTADDTDQADNDIAQSKLSIDDLDVYMRSLQKQSDDIKNYLEHDAMTQADMNMKSQELAELWDNALNFIWDALKNTLTEEEFKKLQTEQNTWIAGKEAALEEAGKDFKGGSMYALIVNSAAADLTEKRACELYDLLLESKAK